MMYAHQINANQINAQQSAQCQADMQMKAMMGMTECPRPSLRVDAEHLLSNVRDMRHRLSLLLDRLRIGPPLSNGPNSGINIAGTLQDVLDQARNEMEQSQFAMNEIEGLL